MRVALLGSLTLLLLGACASDKFALAPPAGVDLSGRWRLNEEESDDPVRLVQGQTDPSKASVAGAGQGGEEAEGRGSRQGRGGRGGFGGLVGIAGPVTPGVAALGDAMRWPSRDVEIKQVAGVVAMSSAGINQVYQPKSFDKDSRPPFKPSRDGARRDIPDRDRGDGPPAICGWEEKTLVIQANDPDDEHPPFEQRYSVSEDGRRLIEVVSFISGRSAGFAVSRTWDRVAADSPLAGTAQTKQ